MQHFHKDYTFNDFYTWLSIILFKCFLLIQGPFDSLMKWLDKITRQPVVFSNWKDQIPKDYMYQWLSKMLLLMAIVDHSSTKCYKVTISCKDVTHCTCYSYRGLGLMHIRTYLKGQVSCHRSILKSHWGFVWKRVHDILKHVNLQVLFKSLL